MEISKRIGQITITNDLIHDFTLMSILFSKFIPVSTHYDFLSKTFTYKGYSPKFDELNEGDTVPVYDCIASWEDRFSDPVIEFKKQS